MGFDVGGVATKSSHGPGASPGQPVPADDENTLPGPNFSNHHADFDEPAMVWGRQSGFLEGDL